MYANLSRTHQIGSKVKKWKVRKNIKKKIWIQINHHITKRKYDGKESEVIFCGKRMKPETVAREIERYGDKSIFTQLQLRTLRRPFSPPVIHTDIEH